MNIAVHLPMLKVHPACLEAAELHSTVDAPTAGSTCRAEGEAAQQPLPSACAAAARLGQHRPNAHHQHSTSLCTAAHSTSRTRHSAWRWFHWLTTCFLLHARLAAHALGASPCCTVPLLPPKRACKVARAQRCLTTGEVPVQMHVQKGVDERLEPEQLGHAPGRSNQTTTQLTANAACTKHTPALQCHHHSIPGRKNPGSMQHGRTHTQAPGKVTGPSETAEAGKMPSSPCCTLYATTTVCHGQQYPGRADTAFCTHHA